MQSQPLPRQPQRTLFWCEATATYTWLDASAKAAAAVTRAKRLAFQGHSERFSAASPLAAVYVTSEFNAMTRHNARNCEKFAVKRAAEKAEKTAKKEAAKAFKSAIVSELANALAVL